MKKPSVGFIIPYYKVDLSLLARAIESVMNLDDHADWEIWVIDDGTPGHDAETYIESLKHPDIHYYAQKNNGPGGARNRGLELTHKEYIHFLDADDYLFRQNTLQALSLLEKEEPDLLAFGFQKVYDTELSDRTASSPHITFRGTGVEFMQKHNLHGSVWGYFFRKSLADHLRFLPIAYHEDEDFTALLFLRARQLLVTTLPVYAYYQRKGSIMHHTGKEFVEKRFSDLLVIIRRLIDESRHLETDSAAALQKRIDMLRMSMVYTLLGDSPDTVFLRRMLKQMRQHGLYPLTPKFYSLTYTAIRLCTRCTANMVILSTLFRLLRFRHAGKIS
ncbi:MAG: glycosyltransferase [Paraprevotella sp.]|nr:glycosyltransferase [Paraprevotella sp.]